MMIWRLLYPEMTAEHLGLLPTMLDDNDPHSAKEQFHKNYQHGGGWHPMQGFKLYKDDTLKYPEDPPLRPIAKLQFRDELIILYEHSWVAIIQPNRSYEVCRMD
jgi:hypothetical protein